MMEQKILWGLLFVNLVYILVGGLIFNLLEATKEEDTLRAQHKNYRALKNEILKNFSCIDEKQLDVLLTKVIDFYEEGELQAENNTNLDWDYDGSIFFATTVVTTIGYGHIAPMTTGGRVFCIFYALIGIPLALVVLAGIGNRINHFLTNLDKKLNKGFFPPKVGSVLRASLFFIIGFTLFVLVPAALFTINEDWTYGDAVYYCVISLTTVGFGDYVAGVDNDKRYGWWYHIMVACWIWIGLAWAATTISSFQESYETIFHPDESNDDTKMYPVAEHAEPEWEHTIVAATQSGLSDASATDSSDSSDRSDLSYTKEPHNVIWHV